MRRQQIPNLISIARILLVIPLVWLLLQERYIAVLWIFAIAGASDALDGYLARRNNWLSPLGAILDPIGDKVLLSTSYLCLAWLGQLPMWLALVVVIRDLVIVAGATTYFFWVERYQMTPTLMSKLNTVVQLLLPLLVMAGAAGFVVNDGWLKILIVSVLVTTVVSGVHYVWIWGKRAWRFKRAS